MSGSANGQLTINAIALIDQQSKRVIACSRQESLCRTKEMRIGRAIPECPFRQNKICNIDIQYRREDNCGARAAQCPPSESPREGPLPFPTLDPLSRLWSMNFAPGRWQMTKNRICDLFAVAMLIVTIDATTTVAQAQTFSVLYNFGSNSGDPYKPAYSGII